MTPPTGAPPGRRPPPRRRASEAAADPGASRPPASRAERAELNFDALYRAYAPTVWHWAVRLGASGPNAQDVTQEVFVVAHRRLAAFHKGPGRDYAPWLFGLTRRVVHNQRSSELRFARVAAEYHGFTEEGVDPRLEQRLDRRQALEHFGLALQALREAERTAFILYEIEELTGPEAAQLMRLHVGNFRTLVLRARHKLLRRLSRHGVFQLLEKA